MATTLSQEQKAEIVKELQAGATGASLAIKYGVSASTISKIKSDAAKNPTATTDATPAPATKEVAKETGKGKKAADKGGKKAEKAETPKVDKKKPTTEITADAPATPTAPTPMLTVFVSSSRLVNKRFDLPANSTFGDLLKLAKEDPAVKGILNGGKNGKELEQSTDALPFTNGQPLYVYLAPIKTSGGK